MTQLVSCDNDARKSAGVLDDGDAVDLFQPLVDDAGSADVREASGPAVALSDATLSPAHVQPIK